MFWIIQEAKKINLVISEGIVKVLRMCPTNLIYFDIMKRIKLFNWNYINYKRKIV